MSTETKKTTKGVAPKKSTPRKAVAKKVTVKKTVAAKTSAAKKTTVAKKTTAKKANGRARTVRKVTIVPNESEIRQRAFELYLHRGGVHGNAMQDWLEAEQELTA